MERITENVRQRLMEAVEECDRVLEEGDAHDLMEAVDLARGSMLAAHELILSLPTGTLDYIKWLEAENEQRVPRWISVHDSLQGMDEKVLFIPACNPRSVYIGKLKYVGEVNAVYFVVNNWRRTVTYSATHWMPRPKTLEEEEHG